MAEDNDEDTRAIIQSLESEQLDEDEMAILNSIKSDLGMEVSSVEKKTGEQEFAEQNPMTARLNEASDVAQTIFGHTFGRVAEKTQESYDRITGRRMGSLALGPSGPAIEGVFALGRGLRGVAEEGRRMGDKMLLADEPLAGGITHVGAEVMDLINPIPASAGEAGAAGAMLGLGGGLGALAGKTTQATKGLLKPLGEAKISIAEEGLRNLGPAARVILTDSRAKKSYLDGVNAFATKRIELDKKLVNAKLDQTINTLALEAQEDFPDFAVMGKQLQDDVFLRTKVAAAPIAAADKAHKAAAGVLGKAFPAEAVQIAEDLKSNLRAVVADSKDAQATSAISRYVELAGDEKKELKRLSIPELMADRSNLKSIKQRLRDSGNRKGAYYVGELHDAIDAQIVKRFSTAGDFAGRLIEQDRAITNGWKKFYETHYNDTAVAIRNAKPSEISDIVFKDVESVVEARKALSENAFEYLRSVKSKELLDKLSKKDDPLGYITDPEKFKPGYWDAVYGKTRAQDLYDFAKSVKEQKTVLAEIQKIEKSEPEMRSRRFKEDIEKDYRRRSEDTRTGAMALAQKAGGIGLGGLFWAMHSPWIATAAAVVGIAPDLMARAFVKFSPAMRKLTLDTLKAQKSLGKAAPMKYLPVIRAAIAEELQGGDRKEDITKQRGGLSKKPNLGRIPRGRADTSLYKEAMLPPAKGFPEIPLAEEEDTYENPVP